MIFQLGITLNVEEKDVQAVIDLDTGLIGFTEISGDNSIEFAYSQSPPEYKKALLDFLMEHAANKSYLNMKISRKSKLAAVVSDFWDQ